MMKKLYILLIYILFKDVRTTKDVGTACKSIENKSKKNDGICTNFKDCKAAIRSVKEIGRHPFTRCKWNNYNEIICCPTITNDGDTLTTKKAPGAENRFRTKTSVEIAESECIKIKERQAPPTSVHISGGEEVILGEFPHMVAIGLKKDNSETYRFDCGGSLISTTFVITAAHCTRHRSLKDATIVRAGVINITGEAFNDKTDFRIKSIERHPERKAILKYHDIALLELDRPIQVSDNLNAICLYTSVQVNSTIPLTATGWGSIHPKINAQSQVLRKANLNFVPNDICKENYNHRNDMHKNIIEEQFCANDPAGHRDTCKGDSGGPLQSLTSNDGYYRLIGITSFGQGICGMSEPAVYTRVACYLDWIVGIVWPDSNLV